MLFRELTWPHLLPEDKALGNLQLDDIIANSWQDKKFFLDTAGGHMIEPFLSILFCISCLTIFVKAFLEAPRAIRNTSWVAMTGVFFSVSDFHARAGAFWHAGELRL